MEKIKLTNDNAREELQRLGKNGIFKIIVPEPDGGQGKTYSELANTFFHIGLNTFDPSLLLSLNAHLWGVVYPLWRFASHSQRSAWLKPMISGHYIGGHAITEPQAGSHLESLKTYAKQWADGFILNGHKKFITNASIADALLVYARTDNGLSAFYVKRSDTGVSFVAKNNLHSFKKSPIGDVILQNCQLPHDRLIGTLGSGTTLLQVTLEHERAFLFAGIAGILEKQLKELIRYVRKRKVGNISLNHHQTINHTLAMMRTRIDTIMLWVNECARLRELNKRISLQSSQLKVIASEAFLASSTEAIQIMGACSLEEHHAFGPLLLDAAACRLLSGTNEIQKNIIANLIGAV